jgi:sulfide:quinone oxidoreductase
VRPHPGREDRAALLHVGPSSGAKVVQSLEGEELHYDLLVLVPPHHGAQFLMDSGLAPAPGGWLPTDHHTLQVGGRPNVYALGDATDLPLSKAGSTAHFEEPIVAERLAAAITGRQPDAKHGNYTGRVMCFFEIGDGKGTCRLATATHPSHRTAGSKVLFNKAYWRTVRADDRPTCRPMIRISNGSRPAARPPSAFP